MSETNPLYENQSYEFPFLSGSNKVINDKINSIIISDLLDIEMGNEKLSIFENVWSTEKNKIPRLAFLKYKTEILNSEIYSVSFFGEGCGAYCEEFQSTYTFLLENGEQLNLENILSDSGQKRLLAELIKYKRELLDKAILSVENDMQNVNATKSDLEVFQMEIGLYKNCFLNYKSLEHFRFVPSDNVIDIYIDRCANHASRALDNVGITKFQLKINEWENEFTELGKSLINN
ncbi:hypothetical protein [Winogradskyella pelagia]|uniref:hypothetical protein n=1 Tax=Winogradskyella pelagia TaxID=2819984 RepID=UPI001AAC4B43|nr:hypothetical protein [Winogradskyella sp. DF17]